MQNADVKELGGRSSAPSHRGPAAAAAAAAAA